MIWLAIGTYLWAAVVVAFADVSYLGAPRHWWGWLTYLAWPLVLPLVVLLEIDRRHR